MRRRSLLPLICHAAAGAILVGAFLFVSVPKVWAALRVKSFGPMLPYHTTNSYMVGLLGVQNGSERLEFAFSALPPDRPAAVVVADGKEENIFLAYVVAYFGWPRQVHSIEVTHVNAEAKLQAFDRNSVSAIFFCGIDPPPSLQPVIKIAPSIVMIPTLPHPEPTAP